MAIGYRNTVTGEEGYWNGDTYMVAGSMYKVALNMYWAEKVYLGEIGWDEPISGGAYKPDLPYETVQYMSIVESDNDYSSALFERMGTYREYRRRSPPSTEWTPPRSAKSTTKTTFHSPADDLLSEPALHAAGAVSERAGLYAAGRPGAAISAIRKPGSPLPRNMAFSWME